MPLQPGSTLGSYEILSMLGAGGMGEVYKAKDARLDRLVAIKVLSDSWRQDPSFLARFEREAKVLASLSHPNIVSIFDFGEVDGRAFSVMELLEGRTLRRAMSEGPMPLREVAAIGSQVARGLAVAHRAGIIHRDLKPENIFLTTQGPVKLLDFGLAKKILTQTGPSGEEEAGVHPTSTNAGVLMGTVGYMAPEQLQADGVVDGRSDLFALGCVLYEMGAGAKAFESETPMGTLHAILTQDPDYESQGLAPPLRTLLRHCLAKPPEQRYQDAQDLAFALDAVGQPSSGAAQALPNPAPRRRAWSRAGVAGALVAVAGLAGWTWTRPPRLAAFTALSGEEGQVFSARFDSAGHPVFSVRHGSADAEVLGWNGTPLGPRPDLQGMLPLRALPEGRWLLLRGTRRLEDGRESIEGDLLLSTGGSPEELADGVTDADASPGGFVAAVRRVDGRYRLEAPIGTIRAQSSGWMESPRLSPTGRWLAFVDHPMAAPGGVLSLLDLKRGSFRQLPGAWQSLHGIAWSSREELWLTASKAGEPQRLYRADLQGQVKPILSAPESLVIEDIAADGRALMLEEHERRGILARGPTGDPGPVEAADPTLLGLSANGEWLTFATQDGSSGPSAALIHLGQSGPVPLGAADLAAPSPDGSRVALASREGSGWRIRIWSKDGSRNLPLLDFSALEQIAWTPTGDALVLGGAAGAGGYRVWRMGLDGQGLIPLCPEGVSPEQPFLLSPDGSALIVQSGPLLTRFNLQNPGMLPETLPGLSPGERLMGWGGDADHLLVVGARMPALVASIDLKDGSRRPAFPLAFYAYPGALIGSAYTAQNAEAFAVSCREIRSRLYLVDGLR